jgi:hypothetical protein
MPAKLTFSDVLKDIERLDCFASCRATLRTALRQTAWSVAFIEARVTGKHLDVDRKKLELARMPFDIATINRLWEGLRYRMAGFTSDKTYRNARWGLRQICRALDMVVPHRAPQLPPDNPYAPLLAVASSFELASVRRFAAYLADQRLCPEAVTNADLGRYGDFLRTQLVGVKIEPMLRRIVQLWRRTASCNPSWPQTPLTLDDEPKPFSPPFAVYPLVLQEEIAAVRRWMEGGDRRGPFSGQRDCKPLRPTTIKLRLTCIRLILAEHVALGNDPRSLTSLTDLLFSPAAIEAILQALWERGQTRHQARVEAEPGWNGNTGQLDAVAVTVLMLARYFPPPSDVLKKLQGLAKAVRKPPMSGMSRKNQQRLEQFRDPVKLGLLLNLARTLMEEALELRLGQPAEAARLARTAIFFAIELRIPLRMQNLHTCRLGHNLRFAGPGSPLAILSFQISEMKTKRDTEYSVSERLCQFLHVYIDQFLPLFAATSPDFADKQWLFPAGDGKSGPLSDGQVRKTIIDTVAERVGAEFHPHLFRALAVEFALKHDPGALEHCRQLLGDKTMQVILTHYAPIRTKEATDRQDRLVNAEADRLAMPPARVKRKRNTRTTQPKRRHIPPSSNGGTSQGDDR